MLLLVPKYSQADPMFKVTKIDYIPEINYFKLHSDILDDGFEPSYENTLKDKYSLFYGDFSYECKIGIRNIKIIASGLNKNGSKYSKTGEIAGGVINIYIDEKLIYTDNDFINYNKVVNKTETYTFSFSSSSKQSDTVGIQHCIANDCTWIKNERLDEINNSEN